MRWFFCTNEGDLQKKWSDTSGLSEHFTGAKLPEKYEIAQNFDAKSPKIYEIAQNFDTLNPARGASASPAPPPPTPLLPIERVPSYVPTPGHGF